jgi:hypothetical protein
VLLGRMFNSAKTIPAAIKNSVNPANIMVVLAYYYIASRLMY